MSSTRRETVELRRDLLDLVRLALDDDWSPEGSAERLRTVVRGERSLRALRARVWRVDRERSTPTSERMLTTVEAALAQARHPERAGTMATIGSAAVPVGDRERR